MADQLQFRGDTQTSTDQFIGAQREVTVDTTNWNLRVHDGTTAGGHALVKKSEVGNPVTIIAPFAHAFIQDDLAGTGTGCSWGAYDSGTQMVAITFNVAQPDTNYSVFINRETWSGTQIHVSSKTTSGFNAKFADGAGTGAAPPSAFPGAILVYASDPTYSVNVVS